MEVDVSKMEETIVICVVKVSLGLLCNAVDCFRSEGGLGLVLTKRLTTRVITRASGKQVCAQEISYHRTA